MKKILISIILIIIIVLIYKNSNLKQQSQYNPYNVDLTPVCNDYEKYFVVTRNKPLQVGEDIIVKYKKDKEEKINCEYVVKGDDFEIKDDNSDLFYTIYNKYIVLDGGTSLEGRHLSVYDLDSKKEVYSFTYHSPLNIDGSVLSFKLTTEEIPDKNNCSNYDEIKSMGGGIALYKNVTFDLDTLTESVSDKKECKYSQ